MNKENKPLEALEQLCDIALCDCSTNELNRIAHYKYNITTALKDYERRLKLAKEYEDINNVMKRLKVLEIIKENLNIDEILLAVKGVCKASDYDLAKEVLENE